MAAILDPYWTQNTINKSSFATGSNGQPSRSSQSYSTSGQLALRVHRVPCVSGGTCHQYNLHLQESNIEMGPYWSGSGKEVRSHWSASGIGEETLLVRIWDRGRDLIGQELG